MEKKEKKIEILLLMAWIVALTATLGSLYYSEIRNFIPCDLCWIQRIFMYPLAILLAIATVKKDANQAYYILPISVIGAGFSFYHYLIEKVPYFSAAGEACTIIPCNYEYVNYFGFITIPFMALTAFMLISLLMISVIKTSKE